MVERAVHGALFAEGLSVLDVASASEGGAASLSRVAARQELRALFGALELRVQPTAAGALAVCGA
jgi:hypothetical protein